MEMPAKEFVAVGVDFESSRSNDDRLVLRAPVLLIFPRHTDTVGVAADPLFGDEFAMHLLVDMIIANPEHRDALGRLLVGLGEAP
jgi:hypothetical protein